MAEIVVPPSLFDSILFDQAQFGGGAGGPLGQTTVGDLIYAALRKAGVTLGPGRTPSPPQQQDALDELRRLTGSLNCDRLFIYAEDMYTFPLVATQKIYTWGQIPDSSFTADFDAPRPQLITRANFIDMNSGQNPLRYQMAILTPQLWSMIVDQNLPNTIPYGLYNDRAYPISNIYFYGQPTSTNAAEIWAWHQVPTYASEADAVILPLQYEDALVLNLACRLAPQFQKEVHPDVRQQAQDSLMRLLSINAPQPIARFPGLCGYGGYNVYSDQNK